MVAGSLGTVHQIKYRRRHLVWPQVNHAEREYVRHEDGICDHNEYGRGLFRYLEARIDVIYHHVGKHYLDQYLREFDFRYNVRKMNDQDRSVLAVKKTSGKSQLLNDASQKNPLDVTV